MLGGVFEEIADEAAQQRRVALDFDRAAAIGRAGDARLEARRLFRREPEEIDGRDAALLVVPAWSRRLASRISSTS